MSGAPEIGDNLKAMNRPVRRVVTGLDADGRSAIVADEMVHVVLWQTSDGQTRATGSQFLQMEMPPGWTSPMHATDTIDYITVLAGEVVMAVETGEVTLRAGDTLVQGGVVHSWRNDSAAPARMAGVLVDIDPVGEGARGLPS